MRKHLVALLAAGALIAGGGVAFAHHPFAAEYDSNKPAQVEGKVTNINWTNPHAFMTVAAKDANGKLTHYRVELGSPRALTEKGWKRGSLKLGQQVTVTGWHGRTDETRIFFFFNQKTAYEMDAASSYT